MSGHEATTSTDFFQVHHGMATHGIDVSHWNGRSTTAVPSWVQFYGMKAAHIGGAKMLDGIDPLLDYNRQRAYDYGVRWRAMYLYLVPEVPQKEQIFKLAEAVGELSRGECVEIDWEEPGVEVLDEEAFFYLDALYPGRWMMYVNDTTAAMTAWMKANRTVQGVPIHHPNWNEKIGWREAKKWEATVWQQGVGKVDGYPSPIDINLVLRPGDLDWVCGWHE